MKLKDLIDVNKIAEREKPRVKVVKFGFRTRCIREYSGHVYVWSPLKEEWVNIPMAIWIEGTQLRVAKILGLEKELH